MRQYLLLPIGSVEFRLSEALQRGEHRRQICANSHGRGLQPGLRCRLRKRIAQPAVRR